MSVQASWELRTDDSPRSLCVYVAVDDPLSSDTNPFGGGRRNTLNPFEAASGSGGSGIRADASEDETLAAQAIVFGTESGSLHYRTYAAPSRDRDQDTGIGSFYQSSLSNTGSGGSSRLGSSPSTRHQLMPLGVTSSGRAPAHLSRSYLPVNLTGALPGGVVAVVAAVPTLTSQKPVFLVVIDDNRGPSASSPGAYVATLVTLQLGTFSKLPSASTLPRVSCATFHPSCGFVYAAGRSMGTIAPEVYEERRGSRQRQRHRIRYSNVVLPTPGARGGHDALEVTLNGRVAAVAVGNSVYAVAGTEISADGMDTGMPAPKGMPSDCVKLVSFAQSSQVHPVIVLDVRDLSMDPEWACLFVANGRECAVLDIQYSFYGGDSIHPGGPSASLSCSPPRNGMVTLASPILAAATSWPWLAVLTSDGLVSIRSPSCLAIPLQTVEVGARPNDFFILRTLCDARTKPNKASTYSSPPFIVALSYSGNAKVLQCKPDTAQDLADRLMRLSIDAFGANGFPRSELAEAVNASFTATSYVGPEPTVHSRNLLREYLQAVLGLAEFDGGGRSGWPTDLAPYVSAAETFTSASFSNQGRMAGENSRGSRIGRNASLPSVLSAASPPALVTGTALLCLVCSQLQPPKAMLANRAAKACAAEIGVVIAGGSGGGGGGSTPVRMPMPASRVCQMIADRLLREASNNAVSLLSGTAAPITSNRSSFSQSTTHMDLVEAASWLLRSSGNHERAIEILHEHITQQQQQNTSKGNDGGAATATSASTFRTSGTWSKIKYESYTATHLSELWGTGQEESCQIVLQSPATKRLLEQNPSLGLGVFTATHPQNQTQWAQLVARNDPLADPVYPAEVVRLLKSIRPAVPQSGTSFSPSMDEEDGFDTDLPLDSGRALAVKYLESAIGISSDRPTEEDEFDSLAPDQETEERIANFHDELCYLLLEGVIMERGDDDNDTDTAIGTIYRHKLRRLLQWPLAKVRSEVLLDSLPKTFLQEQALVLGRLGRHEDALRILYCDLQSMDLALEYCDTRYGQQEARRERERSRTHSSGLLDGNDNFYRNSGGPRKQKETCTYLPLVRVALESDSDRKRGTTAAIQVLALRSNAIDRAAALRLLPKNIPVSAVARPFLIPALVDNESQVRRLTVVSSLLRSRYVALKHQLTDAQLRAQSSLYTVPQLQPLRLGDPLHSTKPIQARPSMSVSSTFPHVVISKHFFPRHVIIQATITNNGAVDGRALGNITFVVAESSEDAIQPSMQVPLKVLPFEATGSTWCVLSATPMRMEATAILTCELRYTVLAVDATTGAPLSFGAGRAGGMTGRTFVEELQDLEIYSNVWG